LAIETVRNKAALRASETRFRSTVESAPVGIALVATGGELLRINRKACEIVGHSHRELLAKGFRGIAHPDDADNEQPLFDQVLSGDIQAYALEKRYLSANGATVWTNLTVSLVHKDDGRPDYLIYILEDIGERKHVEQTFQDNRRELESLSRRLLRAQEAERHSIARELHDEIGQMLTIVKFNLQMVLNQDPTPRLATALTEGMSSIDRVVASVRDLSLNLRPSMLDHLGLEATIRWFVKSQQENLDVQIDLSLPVSMVRPSSEVEISCFRILQEAFTNAARYAQASRIEVTLASRSGAVNLMVRDDGKGFDMAAARRRILQGGGAGLLGMTERAELAGGSVTITSSPGHGTCVAASFPGSAQAKTA
jgi:two-component system sensor histidine kinase UhpB